ncbi:hypothetical protein CAter282_0446 [Collimonas arenae]|uniref:Uncharacterized protein n=1 Tax=Collimonas arenae TaxID=279058 RepID=A0A127QF68_9BURK|nr:hypothetical protein CAter282_0446 [Collimonas arenae]
MLAKKLVDKITEQNRDKTTLLSGLIFCSATAHILVCRLDADFTLPIHCIMFYKQTFVR